MKKESFKKRWILVLALVLIGLVFRLTTFFSPPTALDSDNALYGLMAKHITEGKFPVFTYGQSYMGSLESVVAAAFFKVFGISIYSLKLSPLLFSLLFLMAIYLLGSEIYGAGPSRWALAYAAVGTPTLLVWGTVPRGGYSETLFFGTALLWLSLRILRRAGGGWVEWTALGLLAGLGFWTHFLIGYYFLPIFIVLMLGLGRRIFHWRTAAAGAAFLVGSLPLWIYNVPRDFVSFRLGAVGTGSLDWGLGNLISSKVPELLNLVGKDYQRLSPASEVWFYFGGVIYLVLGLFFLWCSARRVVGFVSRRGEGLGEGIFFLLFLAVLIVFSSSRYAAFHTVRYLLPLYTIIPFLGAAFLSRAGRRAGLVGKIAWGGVILVNGLFAIFVLSSNRPAAQERHVATTNLVQTLETEGETRGVADFWLGERLNFLTEEKVIFSEPVAEHYLPYQFMVESSPRVVFLLNRGEPSIPVALAARGVSFKNQKFGGVRLLSRMEVPFLELSTLPRDRWNLKRGKPGWWVDGMRSSMGGGGSSEEVARAVTLDLGGMAAPSLIRLIVAPRGDIPGRWKVWSSLDGRGWKLVLNHRSPEQVFVSGPRVYHRGMFFRSELRLNPRPARFLRLVRIKGPHRELPRVEELYIYESGPPGEYPGVPDEVMEFLRREEVDFTYADRWESAVLVDGLGKERASVPFNPRYHESDRNGVVEFGRRVAFLVPSTEASVIRKVLTPTVICAERDFGHYTVIVVDVPGEGPSGIFWTGCSLLYEGPEGKALWLRRLAQKLEREGRHWEAVDLLGKAAAAAPGYSIARHELAEAMEKVDPAAGRKLRGEVEREFEPRLPIKAEFEGGVKLLGVDLDRREGEVCLTYYWVFERPPDPGVWVFAHFTGAGVAFQEDHPLYSAGSPLMMSPGNIVKDTRRITVEISPAEELKLKIGLWKPARHQRVKILRADQPVRRRRIIMAFSF